MGCTSFTTCRTTQHVHYCVFFIAYSSFKKSLHHTLEEGLVSQTRNSYLVDLTPVPALVQDVVPRLGTTLRPTHLSWKGNHQTQQSLGLLSVDLDCTLISPHRP